MMQAKSGVTAHTFKGPRIMVLFCKDFLNFLRLSLFRYYKKGPIKPEGLSLTVCEYISELIQDSEYWSF